MQKLIEVMADNAVLSICSLVCGGKCTAIDGFNTSKDEVCKSKITAFLNKYLEASNMQNGLFETSVHRYRSRPIEFDAIRFTRSNFEEVKSFTGGRANSMFIERCPNGKCTCIIQTGDGDMLVTEGEFLIRDINGEIRTCKPDTFFKEYDLVEDS